MPEQRIKKYVEVIADFQPDGTLIPQTVIWDTGLRFDITNISEVMPRKYSKTGGVGGTLYMPDWQSQHISLL